MVSLVPQRTPFIDTPYYHPDLYYHTDRYYQSDPYYHSSPNYSLSFEEKVLQIINNINKHSDQLLAELNKKKVGEVPSQLKSNLEGPYLTHNFNDPLSFSEQSNITLENDWITKQPCTTMETYSIEVDRSNWWDEQLLSSSYSPIYFIVILFTTRKSSGFTVFEYATPYHVKTYHGDRIGVKNNGA